MVISMDLCAITLIGRLVKDPEQLRETKTGNKVLKLRIASNSGKKKEDTVFLDMELWNKLAEFATTLRKGQAVAMTGTLLADNFRDKNGANRNGFKVAVSALQALDRREEPKEEAEEITPPMPEPEPLDTQEPEVIVRPNRSSGPPPRATANSPRPTPKETAAAPVPARTYQPIVDPEDDEVPF